MSQNWLYINSPAWRAFVEAGKQNRLLFLGSTGVILAMGALAATVTINATNPNYEADGYKDMSEQVSRLPMDVQAHARANREGLKAMIMDIQSGKDSERYRATLNGKIYGSSTGTSMREDKT